MKEKSRMGRNPLARPTPQVDQHTRPASKVEKLARWALVDLTAAVYVFGLKLFLLTRATLQPSR